MKKKKKRGKALPVQAIPAELIRADSTRSERYRFGMIKYKIESRVFTRVGHHDYGC
jgi:hypothetical protein